MNSPLETNIVKNIKKKLETIPGVVVRKRHGTAFGIKGDPDLYGLVRGRHFEIEVKRPGENPTELQLSRMREWKAAGAITGVARSWEDTKEVLGL